MLINESGLTCLPTLNPVCNIGLGPSILDGLRFLKGATKTLLRSGGLGMWYLNRKKRFKQRLAHARADEFIRAMSEVKLELGAGPVKGKNGWITIDQCDEADINWDLNISLPFPDESVSIIYSSHVLEHFLYRDLMRLLADCSRVLKPGGSFSVCVPDASIYVQAYLKPETFDRSFLAYKPAIVSDLKMDRLNYIAYMDGHHRFMFDAENLARVLTEAGLTDVRIRDFDPALDMLERKYESIYAVGMKPPRTAFGSTTVGIEGVPVGWAPC